jgi:energy-coupling factor transport system permease protein
LRRLDPRTSIVLTVLFSVLVFVVDNPGAAVILMCAFLGLSFAARLPAPVMKKNFRLLAALLAFITVTQLLFGPGERYLLKIPEGLPFGGRGALKWDGLVLSLVTGCRLAALMLLLPLCTMTTGIQRLALGLTKLGLNYRAAYIVTAVFNLIPALEREALEIIDAQKLRGMRAFEERGLWKKLKACPPLVIPLVLGAMRRSRLLGIAMDARGFGAYPSKTWIETIRIGPADYLAFAVSLVFSVLILTLNFALHR